MTKKILLIKLWAIGEVALITSCIAAIKSKLSDSVLYFLVGNNAKDIVIGNPHLNKLFSIDEKIFLKSDLINLMLLIMRLRREKFDLIITFHYSTMLSFFAFLIGAPRRLGFARVGCKNFNTANIISGGATVSKIYEYLKILKLISTPQPNNDVTVTIYPTNADRKRVASLIKESALCSKRFIMLAPAGGENPAASIFDSNIRNKVWPLEHYRTLCSLVLRSSNYKVVIVGGELERARAVYIKNGLDGQVIDLTGKTNLRELVLLAEESALCVTNDSGPMHLLSASSSSTIAIFGPTDPGLICAHAKNILILREGLKCSPCYDGSTFPNKVKDCKNPICMKRVTPEMVFQKICEILKIDNKKFAVNV